MILQNFWRTRFLDYAYVLYRSYIAIDCSVHMSILSIERAPFRRRRRVPLLLLLSLLLLLLLLLPRACSAESSEGAGRRHREQCADFIAARQWQVICGDQGSKRFMLWMPGHHVIAAASFGS